MFQTPKNTSNKHLWLFKSVFEKQTGVCPSQRYYVRVSSNVSSDMIKWLYIEMNGHISPGGLSGYTLPGM